MVCRTISFTLIIFFVVEVLIFIVGILLSVAFFTLFERKILGLTQRRLGPNKVIFWGILQPVLDGLKLLTKELFFPQFSRIWGFIFAPVIYFVLILMLWLNSSFFSFLLRSNFGVFFLLAALGGRVYTSLLTGVNSFSKFALIGGIRSSAQTVRYEICLAIFIFSFLVVWRSFSLSFTGLGFWIFFLFWFIIIISETNRAPFDFAEGERELIRGFNIEFGSSGFVFLFLGEYGIILFLSFFGFFIVGLSRFFITSLLSFLVVLIRRTLPRFRYDFLMGLSWFFLLPISILIFFSVLYLKFSKNTKCILLLPKKFRKM